MFRTILTLWYLYLCFSLLEQPASLDCSCTTAAVGLIIAAAIRYVSASPSLSPSFLPNSLTPGPMKAHSAHTQTHSNSHSHAHMHRLCEFQSGRKGGRAGRGCSSFTSPVAKCCLTERLRLCQNVDEKPQWLPPRSSPVSVMEALSRRSAICAA